MAMIHMEPQTLQLFERVLETLKPPPNLTLSHAYVCIIASMGTGYPVDYFTGLPLCEAAKLRDAVDADFFE